MYFVSPEAAIKAATQLAVNNALMFSLLFALGAGWLVSPFSPRSGEGCSLRPARKSLS